MDYKQTDISGVSHCRALEAVFRNPRDGVKGVAFIEEQVFSLGDEVLTRPAGGLFKELTVDNMETTFPLLDLDGNAQGGTLTYGEVYQIISSLYFHLAQERDLHA